MNDLFDDIDVESILTWVIGALWLFGGVLKRLFKGLRNLTNDGATDDGLAALEEPAAALDLNEELSALFAPEPEDDAPTPAFLRAIAADLSARVARVHTSMMAPSVVHLRVHLNDCIEKPRLQLLADIDHYADHYRAPHHRTELVGELLIIADELEQLDRMCAYLEHLALQRQTAEVAWLGDADALAESCYRPVVDFAIAQDLGLHTMHPVSLAHGTGLAIDLSFSESKLAPLTLPEGFSTDLLWWPAVAHEIGHDFFHSVDGLRDSLFEEMGLEDRLYLPLTPDHWSEASVEGMFGAWLEEIFCDLIGTLILGPAYVASMTHLFASPEHPAVVWASYGEDGWLGAHPPRHLRVLLCCEVLDYLGQHHAARDYLSEWVETHAGPEGYYLPCSSGDWIMLPPELVEARAKGLVQLLLQDNWEGLEGYHLLDIPGFSYQHAEHARVMAYATRLGKGDALRGDTRLLVAAAVIATRAHPTRAALIRKTLEASIVGLGTGERRWRRPRDQRDSSRMKGRRVGSGRVLDRSFAGELRNPWVAGQAIAVGAAFAPRRRSPR